MYFADAVAEERAALRIDMNAPDMREQFEKLSRNEKKQLENEEDKLLSIMLYNLASFMVMMRVKKTEIRKLIRRLIGKCHISILWCEELYTLLDNIDMLTANDVDLKPLPSNDLRIQSFAVTCPHTSDDSVFIIDVCEECMILKTKDGEQLDYCKYESIVNMTFSPKNKTICIWRREGGLTELHKYKTKKV